MKKSLSLSFVCAAFLFIVLYVYEGFNIFQEESLSGHGFLTRTTLFALLTFIIFSLMEWIYHQFFTAGRKHRVMWSVLEIFFGAIATYILFNYFWGWTEWTWQAFGLLIMEYTAVMIIPVGLFISSEFRKQGSETDIPFLNFVSENEKEKVIIRGDKLIYITSESNYLDVYFESDGKVIHKLIRGTLKEIENNFEHSPWVVRCHRSYMINPAMINHIEQAPKNIRVSLKNDITIPVSKKYEAKIKEIHP